MITGRQRFIPAILPIVLALSPVVPEASAANKNVGVARCRICHLREARSWEQTKMAHAFDLLTPGVRSGAKRARGFDPNKDYSRDPTCLPCHTTGYGEPGGFVTVEETPKMAGVQCEVCHGAGEGYLAPHLMSLENKSYKRADLLAAGLILPAEPVCLKCHNDKNPFAPKEVFHYELHREQGTHERFPLQFPH